MKKILIIAILFVSTIGFSQDVITLTDGRTVNAKILELTTEFVKYKKTDNLEGPTYTLPVNDLTKIKYANGSEDTFAATPKPNPTDDPENIPSIFKGKFDVNDSETASYIEAIAKNAGAKVLERCVGRCENQYVDIYYADVYRDDIAMELHIPIQVKWQKRSTESGGSWIRGEVIINKSGKRNWKHQNDSGSRGSCSKGLLEL